MKGDAWEISNISYIDRNANFKEIFITYQIIYMKFIFRKSYFKAHV